MKLRIALLALAAAAGVFASIAVAKPPSGHGNPHDGVTTTGTTTGTTGTTTTTSSHGKKAGKVLVCHRVGNGKYVLVKVSANSALAKGKHGDVVSTNGTCPGPIQGHGGQTTSTTTTAAQTTTATTTTTTVQTTTTTS
jgi:hypothetical protein